MSADPDYSTYPIVGADKLPDGLEALAEYKRSMGVSVHYSPARRKRNRKGRVDWGKQPGILAAIERAIGKRP